MRNWPGGVTDGLTLPCGKCGVIPPFCWMCDDALWRRVVPESMRLGVVCLPCFDAMAAEINARVIGHIERVQFVGTGYTVVLYPGFSVKHSNGNVINHCLAKRIGEKNVLIMSDAEWRQHLSEMRT